MLRFGSLGVLNLSGEIDSCEIPAKGIGDLFFSLGLRILVTDVCKLIAESFNSARLNLMMLFLGDICGFNKS